MEGEMKRLTIGLHLDGSPVPHLEKRKKMIFSRIKCMCGFYIFATLVGGRQLLITDAWENWENDLKEESRKNPGIRFNVFDENDEETIFLDGKIVTE